MVGEIDVGRKDDSVQQLKIADFTFDQSTTHINVLANETIGHVLRKLDVADRLCMERVSPRWQLLCKALGWTEQKKLDFVTIFSGPFAQSRMDRYSNEFLVSLFHRVGASLRELDLASLRHREVPISVQIFVQLCVLPKLEKIVLWKIRLECVSEYLPGTLREIHFNLPSSAESLSMLAQRCPNLEIIILYGAAANTKVSMSNMNTFLGHYPGLKKLWIHVDPTLRHDETGTVISESPTSIAQFTELEELCIHDFRNFDEASFLAMTEHCHKLKRLFLNDKIPSRLTATSLFRLANLPHLTDLTLRMRPELTDLVLKKITQRGILKKLDVAYCEMLTDNSISHVVSTCKSLVKLNVMFCRRVTDRSLEAVLAEVHRRHGRKQAIHWEKARELTAGNPWVTVDPSWEQLRENKIKRL